MDEAQRLEQYRICQKRGHAPSGTVLASNPPWQVCEFCGTHYRWSEPKLIESNVPTSDDHNTESTEGH